MSSLPLVISTAPHPAAMEAALPESADRTRVTCARIASGDPEAFTRFFEARFDWMLKRIRLLTGRDEAFCLDVIQDAMLRVIRSIQPLDSAAALDAWLTVVLKSCAYDRLRAEQRRIRRERQAARGRVEADENGRDSAEFDEQLRWLRHELSTLSGQDAAALNARWRLGAKLRQVGACLGLRTGAADRRLNRAIDLLSDRATETFDD